MTACARCLGKKPFTAEVCESCGAPLTEHIRVALAKSEAGDSVMILVIGILILIGFLAIFVVPIPCTVRLFSGYAVSGHATLWQMLTGNTCTVP